MAIFISIPPTFLVLMPLLGIIIFWPLKKWVCLRRNFPSEAEKNAFFKLNLQNLVHVFCQHFTEIHYSFPMTYWLSLCLFLPPFHFSFMILAIIMPIPLTFPVLMPLPNYYKRFSIEGKTDLSEGRVPPQKLIEIMQFSNSICTGTRRYSNTP